MIFKKDRFWVCLLILSIFCLGFQFFRPRYDQKFPLKYSLPQQTVELGEIPAATYQLSALYISGGDFAGGPDSKIEVFNQVGTKIYTNIHKNDDLQITPEFQVSERQYLKAKVELIDSTAVGDASLELRLRHQDEPIHAFIFWSGMLGLLISTYALIYFRKIRPQQKRCSLKIS
jgi:hypothetical protein